MLVSKVYDKLKEDIIIKKLEEMSNAILSLQKTVEVQGKRIEENTTTINDHNKLLEEVVSLLSNLQKSVDLQYKTLEQHSKTLEEHSKEFVEIEKRLEEQNKRLEEQNKNLEEQGRRLEEMNKTLLEHIKRLEEQSNVIAELQKVIVKLSAEIGCFTSRAGKGMERTMLLLYKEALKLHNVNPDKVVHGKIVDTLGVVEKGRIFEVDFYETNDYVYVFEIKNFVDEGAFEQILIRKKLIPALFNKPVKIYLVANYVEDWVKEELEKEGVIIIASIVVNTKEEEEIN
ncbi:hypothetical protein HLB03_05725 [Acidianus sp. DSM 29099]|nr:hypothetical protein [Acidianus sp. RZ1]NON62195.1 hypothetical protein [Acidianus sp. RZ1]